MMVKMERREGFLFKETQSTPGLSWFLLAVLALSFAALQLEPGLSRSGGSVALFLLILWAAIGFVFSSFTVEVDKQSIRVYLRGGFFRKQFPVSEAVEVGVEELNPFLGFGVRYRSGLFVFRLNAGPVVRVRFANGDVLLISHPRAEDLARAISTAMWLSRRAG